ncbi:tetratricopeptide repeat protein [Granulosicoccaceae sp. 1_MG-2023]|nr:tetratricopeptide repeat protein [Granulosicoccaceae sp. 1_MG-2023]
MPTPSDASHPALMLEHAKTRHRRGRRAEAAVIYRKILAQDPHNAEALRLLGVLAMEENKPSEAAALLRLARGLAPHDPAVHNNLGSLAQQARHPEEAEAHFRYALQLQADFVPALCNLGNLMQQTARPQDALPLYEQALAREADNPVLWNNLGNLHSRQGRPDQALGLFNRALELDPDYAEAHSNRGLCFHALGDYDKALQATLRALELRPGHAGTLNNCGNALLKLHRSGDALVMFRAAMRADPALAEACNGAGLAYRNEGKPGKAITQFRRALSLNPRYAVAWNNLGLASADAGLACEALNAFRKALAIDPGYASCHSNLLFCMNYQDDIDPRALADAHERWAIMHQYYPGEETAQAARRATAGPIRAGFVSADLCRHPVAYFLLPVLRELGRHGFVRYVYSGTPAKDDMTATLHDQSDYWRETGGLDDRSLQQQIRADGIDLLFDLSGHTSGNRLRCFSLRAAPLQLSWLGYPHTTGLENMDYIISDAISLPPYLHWQFSEQILHLPSVRCCYEAPPYAPPVAPLPCSDNKPVTFGSFNNPVKLSQRALQLWAGILHRTPGSRLVLSWKTLDDPTVVQGLQQRFCELGIEPQRLTLLGGKRAHAQVLADYAQVDIALDCWPFSGGITSCEALWMGVPVVTLAGKLPASRQTAGFLAALFLDELICFTPEDFVNCAAGLAENREKLQALRQSLRPRMQASPLTQAGPFGEELATLLKKLHAKHSRQQAGMAHLTAL